MPRRDVEVYARNVQALKKESCRILTESVCFRTCRRFRNVMPLLNNQSMMKVVLLVATVLLQKCCSFASAYRIHTNNESAIYRLLGHPAVSPLTRLAQQINLIDEATPCLLRAAHEEQEVLQAVQALRQRSTQLKPLIKDVRK